MSEAVGLEEAAVPLVGGISVITGVRVQRGLEHAGVPRSRVAVAETPVAVVGALTTPVSPRHPRVVRPHVHTHTLTHTHIHTLPPPVLT